MRRNFWEHRILGNFNLRQTFPLLVKPEWFKRGLNINNDESKAQRLFMILTFCLRATKKTGKKNLKDEKKEGETSSGPPPTKRRKGRAAAASDAEPSYVQKIEVKIDIPQDLKRFLLDDCDFVTRQKQLVPVPKPANLTVKGICESYMEDRQQNSTGPRESTLSEVTSGIMEYFNVMLGSHLLYKFERTQYSDILKDYPNKPMCEMYGCEHLLRLFVKLSTVLSYSSLDETSMEFIVIHIHDFLEYMMKCSEDLFAAEYETATPDYHRRSAV